MTQQKDRQFSIISIAELVGPSYERD